MPMGRWTTLGASPGGSSRPPWWRCVPSGIDTASGGVVGPGCARSECRSGLLGNSQCGRCGGSLIVHSRTSGGHRAHAYLCSYHHLRGNTVCPGGLVLPVELTNHVTLAAIEGEVLHPD